MTFMFYDRKKIGRFFTLKREQRIEKVLFLQKMNTNVKVVLSKKEFEKNAYKFGIFEKCNIKISQKDFKANSLTVTLTKSDFR